jgi:lysozyme family protein
MDNFQKALDFTLRWEGLYVFNKNDPGGETMKGIIKTVYDAYRDSHKLPRQSVKLITDQEVYDIYSKQYWIASGADKITNPKLAISVFDMAVNTGVSRAKRYLGLTQDYKQFNKNRLDYYQKIANNNPKLQVFLKGWNNRTNDLIKYLETL